MKPAAVRRAGKVPAVFYGRKRAAVSIAVPAKEFSRAFARAGENEVITLSGAAGEVPCLVHEVSRHPVSDAVEHVDFYAFEKGQKVAVKVPLEFTGVAPAVKEKGAVLVKVLRDMEIEAEPAHLPHSIAVDISGLVDFGSQLLARDIALPAGVALKEKPEEVVASVYEPKEEKPEETAAAPDLSAIEVTKKGKEEKEGEGEALAVSPTAPNVGGGKHSVPSSGVGPQKGEKKEKK